MNRLMATRTPRSKAALRIVVLSHECPAFHPGFAPLCADGNCVCVGDAQALFSYLHDVQDPPDAIVVDRTPSAALAIAKALTAYSDRTLAIFVLAAKNVPAFRWAIALNPALGNPLVMEAELPTPEFEQSVSDAIVSFRHDLATRDAVEEINRGVERRAALARAQIRRDRVKDRYLANLLAQIPDVVVSTDMEGSIAAMNQAASVLFELGPDAALGRPLSELLPDDAPPTLVDLLQRAKNARDTQRDEIMFSNRGAMRYFDVSVTQTVDDTGRAEALLVIMRDISAQKAALEKLETQTQELARSNADLEQFAYVASHDLKEPLRTITSYSQLLLRRYGGKMDADADEFIGYVVEGAHRMHRLIGDLLNYSRAGGHKLNIEPTPLADVIKQAMNNISLSIAETSAEIRFDTLPTIALDKSQMVQVFQNLLSNAIKFRGSSIPRIRIHAEYSSGYWRLSVADNGIGIEPTYLEHIFVAFKRLYSEDRYPGSGIGLAICKKIVERHGGAIWAESRLGHGSTFSMTLPA